MRAGVAQAVDVIVVDTSALVDSLCGSRNSAPLLRELIAAGQRLTLPTMVLYEWWRGPRRSHELDVQEALFPSEQALDFGVHEAEAAARLYTVVSRPRGRELDLAIASHALVREASLWTLNPGDFSDIPGINLVSLEP